MNDASLPDLSFSRCLLAPFRRFVGLTLLLCLGATAQAGVYLSHYTFSSANVPYVYTNEGLDIPFKLRVKIIGVPGYGNGFHAAQAWNNNYYSLESLPPPGTYTVALYWLKYASDWTTLLEVGPQTTTTITVQSPPAVNGVAWGAINLPTDGSGIGLPGQSITATASVTNNGSTTWNSNYYLELKDSNGTPLSYPSINGVSPGNSTTATFVLTLPATAGVYTYAFTALQNNVQYFGGTQSRTITVNRNPVTSSFTASASAISAGQSVTLSSIVTDPDSNLTSQAIDYLAPGSGTWTSGTVGAGTRWDGAVTGANTLTKALLLSTDGTWQFRVRGGDALGGTSAFLYQNVTVTTTTPVITTQPTSQSAFVGGAVTFSVGAGGAAPLNYQWRKNGANVGTNSASLTISAATAADAASYTVTVSNAFGSVTSNPVTLTVSAVEPIRLAVKYWQANDFPGITIDDYEDVEVSGTRTIDEYDEWGNWTGSYEEEYTEIQSQWVGSTTYANGRFGSRWDTTAGTFDIATAASGYSAATANRGFFVGTYAPGDYITFHAFASAPSANCSSFTWTLFAPSNGPIVASSFGASSPHSFYAYYGTGYYRVEVSYQNATSGTPLNATVSYYIPVGVSLPPTITTQPGPTNQTVASGATVTYSVVASLATTYQWRKDGVSISGATASTLTLTNVQPSNSGSYTVVVGNTGGSQTSAAANLTVSVTAPAISSQPVSQTTNVGQPVGFTVSASGTAPLAYQWSKNGVALAGATNASLTLANPQTTDAANAPGYTVLVSNVAGTATSSAAALTVNLVAPSITTQPISQSTFTGGTVTFSVVAGGTAPFSYQWRKNGVNVGTNSSSFTISSALTSDAAAYNVVVSNGAGAVTSNAANLTVTVVEPIRLAVKYWRANDYPNRYWYSYEEVWVGWRTVDEYDENGDWTGSYDEWIGWEWDWVYHSSLTGQFGPRWDTTAGDFDIASAASGYSANTANRGFFLNPYSPGDKITFHLHATAPSANCSNYTWALFSPSGAQIAGYGFSGITAWSVDANYGVGNYRVDVSYQSATSGTPLNATVSYYIPVGVAPPAVPAITSPLAASGTVGTAFAYTITATNSPTSFGATGLPAGLALNTSNGAITGTPSSPGTFSVSLNASNAGGTSLAATMVLTVGSGVPVITSPLAASGTVGTAFAYTITATNSPTSFGATSLPAGLSLNTATGSMTGTPTVAGTFNVSVIASNAGGASQVATLVLMIEKATPVFVSRIDDAPSMAITSAMLMTAFRAPGNSGLVAPDFTQAAFTVPHPHTPNTTLNAIGQTYNRFSPAVITARFLGDANYLPVTLTATFSLTDSEPPSSPTNLHQVLLAANSFSVEWNPSTDNSLVKYYEVSVNGGTQVLQTRAAILNGTASPTTMVVNGVAAGATHTVKVRAVDWFNLPSSEWATAPALSVTTPSAPPQPPTASQWIDVNSDGIPDEAMPAGSASYHFYEAELGTRTVTQGSWEWEFVPILGLSYSDGWNFYVGGFYVPNYEDTSYTVDTVRPGFEILAEPGYDYTVTWNVVKPNGTTVRAPLFPRTRLEPVEALSSAIHDTFPTQSIGTFPVDTFYAFPTTLVRIGLPVGGIQLDLGVLGKLKIDTGGGLRGTISLPGNITIQATSGGTSVTFPGGTSVSTSGGTVTVGQTVGGYAITGNSNGNITLTSPTTGATIGLGPNGGTLTTAGGFGISVAANGTISLAVPQGSGQRLDSALDVLGKILGSGPVSANAQIQVLPTSANRVLTTGGWAGPLSVDLGSLPPGDYDVAVRSQDAARDPALPPLPPQIWVTLKVTVPQPNLGIVYPATGEISATRALQEGGLVAIRRDSGTPITKLRLHQLVGVPNAQFKLVWSGSKINIWRDAARTQAVTSDQSTFPLGIDTDVYLEGTIKSAAIKDVQVILKVNTSNGDLSQTSIPLTVVDAEFDIQIKMWIREQWIFVPWTPIDNFFLNKIAGGDDRDNNISPGAPFRVTQIVTVIPYQDLDADGIKDPQGSVSYSRNLPGISSLYYKPSSVPNPAGPYSLANRLLPTATPANSGVPRVDRMHIDPVSRTGSNLIQTHFYGAANDPLITGSADIDWDITVTIDGTNLLVPTYDIRGGREGYPAIEIDIGDSIGRRTPQPFFWLHPLPSDVYDLIGGTLIPLPTPIQGNVR